MQAGNREESPAMPDVLPLPQNLHTTLRAVAQALQMATDPWWVIGSAAVALHGAGPLAVADIDVLLSPDDAGRVFEHLGLHLARGADHPKFRSDLFGTWLANPLPVEFMAGFRHWRAGSWVAVEPRTRISVQDVFVPSRDELRAMIEAFGRPKDMERARLLG
jgi:hypothetical protein